MVIGGFSIKDEGYGLSVKEYEAGWAFWLQGEDAERFREEWDVWQEARPDCGFREFLRSYEYDALFQ